MNVQNGHASQATLCHPTRQGWPGWLVRLAWLAGGACVAGLAGLIGWPGWLVYLAGPLAWPCWQGLAGLANDWPYLAWPRWLVLLGWLVGQAGRPG